MNENEGKKRREWVKNAAIIFLTIMLILTFFSNTIMNYSLPEVATQYVQSGSITAKVRGTGNVEATDPYNVMVKDTRVISSVAVKQGDKVEKDQVLYYLEDKESDELGQAEKELADLELAYMKGLFGSTVSPEVINKVASGNTDSFSSYRTMVTDMQQRLQAAEDRVNECQKVVESITLENTISTNDAGVSTAADELAEAQANTDLTNATTSFEEYKSKRLAELDNEIKEKQYQIDDLKLLISEAKTATGSGGVSTGGGTGGASPSPSASISSPKSTSASETLFEQQRTLVGEKIDVINALGGNIPNVKTQQGWPWENEVRNWYNNIPWTDLEADIQKKHEAAYGEYRVAVDSMNATAETLREYGSNNSQQSRLEGLENELRELQQAREEVSAITVNSNGDVQDAKNRLEQAQRNIREINNANKQASTEALNRLANAEAALKNAQAVYELLKTEQTELAANINAELDLSKASKDIASKKEEIEKLKENSTGATINAPVAGTVTNLAYVAGETTKPEEAAAVIQVEGKGYTMSVSVTNEQAKNVQVGDTAELQNAWYYDDVQVILSSIKPDPDNPAQKKLLVFNVTGESIQAGQALNISVGQRSSEYEFVVPNSAVREDNNGKFILIVESRSGPINNRYIATRVDVDVLASDDTNTAISAALYGYEYVITTSTKPVEAGKQVRLNES